MANFDDQMPLRKISEAFKDLANTVNSQNPDLELAPFWYACSLISPHFACLGIAF
ncbi:Accelerated cell death like [Actinidia chinensis var. chinensis]|uniref:Accelerated cell death like n=1 Tax=Actinidia chinensis var. chinensis TaxID=1590841 RepID=A0A2R6PYA2_ACTCC|nr:Accelerated cell death like [Actinidia chinensis var. chinensis]